MKRIVVLALGLLLNSNFSLAQDAYHSALTEEMQQDHDLPIGEWVIANTEDAVIGASGIYGATHTVADVVGQSFSKKQVITVPQAGDNPWDAGRSNRNTIAVNTGEKVLMTFWLRDTDIADGDGKVSMFAENATTFAKEVFIDTEFEQEWKRYFVAFEAVQDYPANGMALGFHLAHRAQTIEVGGFTAIKYPSSVDLDDIPTDFNSEEYDGFEDDAPWRAIAATNIENIRKANLTIDAKNNSGAALDMGDVTVKMLQHEFAFGSAVVACRYAGNSCQTPTYENKIIDLDGKGHGFNEIVFENDLKWDLWENSALSTPAEVVKAIAFARDRDIDVRGHNLVWPGSQYMPDDINANINDIPYLKNRINEHLEEILNYPGVKGNLEDWDVINEIVANRTLENAFMNDANYDTGRELYAEIFSKAKELAPEATMYLNDYVTLSVGTEPGDVQYDRLKEFLGEIIDAGAPVEGIGFQGHIGANPNGIPAVLATYDDFYQAYGLKAKITEFDMPPAVSEELAAKYLNDFLTATFSHVSMEGFLFWNFWDGSTWANPGANLFREDWSLSLPGEAFIDLVFNKWWTEEKLLLAESNRVVNGFKGKYEISYSCDGEFIKDTISLTEAMTYEINCETISVGLEEIVDNEGVRTYPNPAGESVTLEIPDHFIAATAVVTNTLGQMIQTFELNENKIIIGLPATGTYFIKGVKDGRQFVKRVQRF